MLTTMNSISKHVSTAILTVVVVLALLLVLDYSAAQWQSAPGSPPNNNVAAPINVGPSNQDKNGRIGADQFIAFDRMRSDLYCDLNGNNCFQPSDVGSGGSATASDVNLAPCSAMLWSYSPYTNLPSGLHGQIEMGGSDSSYYSPGMYQCLNGTWEEVYPPAYDNNS